MENYEHLIVSRKMGPKTQHVYDFLTSRVIGQERAARRLTRRLELYHSGLKDPRKPIGVFLLAGPTGTGKTMMAEMLARCLISNATEAPLTRIPCTKLTQAHEVTSLTGAPPSYVGFDRPVLLKQEMIDNPHFRIKAGSRLREIHQAFSEKEAPAKVAELREELGPFLSVILFDEIEKAHETIWNLLLNIVGDGTLGMNDGSKTSFANSVIILTCNVGGREQQERTKRSNMGFSRSKSEEEEAVQTDKELYKITLKRIEETFAPEFIGRIRDSIVVFRHPTLEDVRRALENHFDIVQDRLDRLFSKNMIDLKFDEGYTQFLLQEGYNRQYGMRPLDQAVERHCLMPLAVALEAKEIQGDDKLLFVIENGEVRLRRANRPKPQPKLLLPPLPPKPTPPSPAPPAPTPTPPPKPPLSLPPLAPLPPPPAPTLPEEPLLPKKDGE